MRERLETRLTKGIPEGRQEESGHDLSRAEIAKTEERFKYAAQPRNTRQLRHWTSNSDLHLSYNVPLLSLKSPWLRLDKTSSPTEGDLRRWLSSRELAQGFIQHKWLDAKALPMHPPRLCVADNSCNPLIAKIQI